MIASIRGTECVFAREQGDPRLSSDSTVMHHVKQALNKQGYDLVKLRMWRDGHMVDDRQQYLRARNPNKPARDGVLCIYDGKYAVRMLHEEYRERGEARLDVQLEELRWVFVTKWGRLALVVECQRARVKLRCFSAEGGHFERARWVPFDKVTRVLASDPRARAAEIVRRRVERLRTRKNAERRPDHAHARSRRTL